MKKRPVAGTRPIQSLKQLRPLYRSPVLLLTVWRLQRWLERKASLSQEQSKHFVRVKQALRKSQASPWQERDTWICGLERHRNSMLFCGAAVLLL